VEQNIRAVLEVHEKARRSASIRSTIAGGIPHSQSAHRAAIALSGGERRRLEIARALATTRPSVLDEPFAGVDPISVGTSKTSCIT